MSTQQSTEKYGDKSAVAILKDARQLGCVFQDTEPRNLYRVFTEEEHKRLGIDSTSAIHKSYAASCKHPRKQGSVARTFSSQSSHQRSTYALNFEDRSEEETERQERCARGDAWRLAKNILSSKKRTKLHSSHRPMSGVCRPHPQ